MSPTTTCWLILATLALLLGLTSQILVSCEIVSIPPKCRTEGRATLIYQQGGKTIKQYLAFAETLDSLDQKSVVSIGAVSYTPKKYYSFSGRPSITLDSDGLCTTITEQQSTTMVPELAWFVDMLLPGVILSQYTSKAAHFVGPSGFLTILIDFSKDKEFEGVGETIVHRNIPCWVFRKKIQLPGEGITTLLETYKPKSGVQFHNLQSNFFSVKATTTREGPAYVNGKETTSLIIDYFDVDNMDDSEGKSMDRMANDFNLPLASGCSEFLEQVEPEIKARSFSLNYRQMSNSDSILMAYDHESSFLRREKYGESVSIWDLNEDLLYHIDTNITSLLDLQANFFRDHKICSVSRVTDVNLGPAFRPYERQGESLDVLRMIGATKVAYLGRGSVRDLPCAIYETILPEVPDLFALTSERSPTGGDNSNNNKPTRDYIVQFYLLQGPEQPGTKFGLAPTLSDESFWPAQILLYRRTKDSYGSRRVEFLDQLDIYDFFWSLDGWNKKNNQLFMASECFDDEDEQLRLEVAVTFDLVHQQTARKEDRKLLPYNRLKLEYDLVNNIFSLLQTSKIHLIQYELRLRPHHVDLNMIIGDRKEDKIMTYFGTGTVSESKDFLPSQVLLTQLSEEDCVMASSLLDDISLVVHCPAYHGANNNLYDSTCLMITGEKEPTIIKYDDTKGSKNTGDPKQQQQRICQVYRFASSAVQKKGTNIVDMNKYKLIGHEFNFSAKIPEDGAKSETIKGMVRNYDISHEISLIVINHYMFTLPIEDQSADSASGEQHLQTLDKKSSSNQNVRSIQSIVYESLSDCVKICNLDVNCRSYSYCSSENDGNQCHLSSMDIRASKLQDQLIHSKVQVSESKIITVEGGGAKYGLEFLDHCDIYERNYLNIYRQTDEIIRLQKKLINQFRVAPTTFDCAKQSVDLELSSSNHHVAMFAYCPTSNTCLLDENLFASSQSAYNNNNNNLKGNSTNENDKLPPSASGASSSVESPEGDELLCKVYRKKYQTYFHVSAKVLKRQPEQQQQVELAFDTVEECARACWNKFGQVCSSFDYCSPKSCLINGIHMDSGDGELEVRQNCLHYERDLQLDELRRRHLIGRHEILQEQEESSHRTPGNIIMSILTYFLVFCAFIYGLVLGRQVNDKMEAVTILRQSVSAASGQRARQMSGFMGGAAAAAPLSNNHTPANVEGSSNFYTMPDQFGTDAIRLSVIKRSNGNEDDDEPLDRDF